MKLVQNGKNKIVARPKTNAPPRHLKFPIVRARSFKRLNARNHHRIDMFTELVGMFDEI